jgi:branched-subunit amino acid aminotransferase/4-amino-4-deoxychorismate lyase
MPRKRREKKSDSVLFKSAEWIGWAIGGLEREIEETRERLKVLTDQAAALRSRVGVAARRGVAAAVAANAGKPVGTSRRGRMSAEGRRRMSEMMKKRWQEAKKKNRNRL